MIDFEQALRSQEDIDALCTGPLEAAPLEREFHASGYGFAQILKSYAGYPLDMPVEAVIPHGVYLDAREMLTYELETTVPAVLNYPAFRAHVWRAESDKVIIPSASPFLYALAMFKERFPDGPSRQGTLFFTPHREGAMNIVSDYSPLFRALDALDERYKPVTVCISIVDYRMGDLAAFQDAGFDVVCAGQPEDQEFTYRLLHLMSRHRYAAGTRVGGYVFYAVAAGLPCFLIDAPELHRWNVAAYLGGVRASRQERDTTASIARMLAEPSEQVSEQFSEVVDYMLGAEDFKTPEQLRADLEHAAELAKGVASP